jgi:hypothetical protein
MIGIFENLPDEIIDHIWNYTHNKNMENVCKNIKEISNYFNYKNGYNGKSIYSWDTAIKTLLLTIN